MEIICEKEHCTGCTACAVSCPKNAISMKENDKGFIYPYIDKEACVDCGLCKNVCPQLAIKEKVRPNVRKVYAAFTKDLDIRNNSSSGGMFTELARSILQEGGVVFASRMSDNCHELYFDKCERVEDLDKFRGSKYLQSHPKSIFLEIKKELELEKMVLFIGTACQVAGLKSFLKKKYDKLFTVDIICHGVPSPKLWSDYMKQLEQLYCSSAKKVNFRYKKPSWTKFSLCVEFENGHEFLKSKFDDPYLISFLKEMALRDNCYTCPYTNIERVGDITLADFWGYKSTDFKMRNTEKGISLVLINSDNGTILFKKIVSRILFTEKRLKDAVDGNRSLKEPWSRNPLADEFWGEYLKGAGLQSAFKKYCKPYRFPLKMKINWFALNHLYLVPRFILRMKGLIK